MIHLSWKYMATDLSFLASGPVPCVITMSLVNWFARNRFGMSRGNTAPPSKELPEPGRTKSTTVAWAGLREHDCHLQRAQKAWALQTCLACMCGNEDGSERGGLGWMRKCGWCWQWNLQLWKLISFAVMMACKIRGGFMNTQSLMWLAPATTGSESAWHVALATSSCFTCYGAALVLPVKTFPEVFMTPCKESWA